MEKLIELIRRHIEEIGDCWEWNGAFQADSPTPMMRFGRKTGQVRRFVAIEQGLNVEGKVATCKCRNELCVNPDHVIVVTRSKLQRLIAKELQHHVSPLRMKRLADRARERSPLTPEQVQEIKDSEESQRTIAARYGITQASVSSIKRGRTWKEYSNPFAGLYGARK